METTKKARKRRKIEREGGREGGFKFHIVCIPIS